MAAPLYVAQITGVLAEQLAEQRGLHVFEGIFVLLSNASFFFKDGDRKRLVAFKQHDVVDGSFFEFLFGRGPVTVVTCDEVAMADLVCNYVDKRNPCSVCESGGGTCDLLAADISQEELGGLSCACQS